MRRRGGSSPAYSDHLRGYDKQSSATIDLPETMNVRVRACELVYNIAGFRVALRSRA